MALVSEGFVPLSHWASGQRSMTESTRDPQSGQVPWPMLHMDFEWYRFMEDLGENTGMKGC